MKTTASGSALRGLSALGAILATASFVVVGVLVAAFFAATVAVLAFIASALLAVTGLVLRARRRTPAKVRNDGVIEARHVGGHNWVAYGWNERR